MTEAHFYWFLSLASADFRVFLGYSGSLIEKPA